MGKVLVIVDVQKEFDEYIQHDLVDALSEYAEKFDIVYQIWDTHNNTVAPTHSFPGQIDSVPKKYGKKHFSDEVKQYMKQIEDSSDEGRTFKLTDDEGYIVRVKNNHTWFYVNPEIVDLISKIKNDKIILAGGADGECLEDVYQTFKAFGLNVHINKKYTYSAKTTEEDSIEEKKKIPAFPKLEEVRNSKQDAIEIAVYLEYSGEKLRLNDVVQKIDRNYAIGFVDKYPCVVYFRIDRPSSCWGNDDAGDDFGLIIKGEFDNESLNGVYEKLFTINDLSIIEKILKEKKIVDRIIPMYVPKKFIRESYNDIEDAREIVIKIENEQDYNKLLNLLRSINNDYYEDMTHVFDNGRSPYYYFILFNLDERNNSPNGITSFYTNNDYEIESIENGSFGDAELDYVYKRLFTIDELDIVERIIRQKSLESLVHKLPNYRPRKFLRESFNPDRGDVLFFDHSSPEECAEAQKFALSKGYLWGSNREKYVQYTDDKQEAYFLEFRKDDHGYTMYRVPVNGNELSKLEENGREYKEEFISKYLYGNSFIYTYTLEDFKRKMGGIPEYRPRKFIR